MPSMNPKTQRDDRLSYVGLDQFGRPWLYRVEKSTLDLTGDIQPGGRWIQTPVGTRADGRPLYANGKDPLRTPMKYFKLPKGYAGRPDFSRILIDFDAWISDQKRALTDWVNWLWAVGQQLNPGAKTIYDIEKDPRCLAHAGDKPWPSIEILQLAKAGSPELLGLKPMSPETEKLLGQISVESILQDSLQRFQPDEQAAFKALAEAIPSRAVPPEPVAETDDGALTTWPDFYAFHKERGKSMAEVSTLWRARKAALQAA